MRRKAIRLVTTFVLTVVAAVSLTLMVSTGTASATPKAGSFCGQEFQISGDMICLRASDGYLRWF